MKLIEMLDQRDIDTAYYDPAEDEVNQRKLGDTRKPVLTLKHLNRLNKIRALRRLEDLKQADLLTVMYASPEEEGGMGMGGMGGGPGL